MRKTGGRRSLVLEYPADPFNYRNDYTFLPFDRRNIFNASYSYDFGKVAENRLLGAVANGWELSGITNYQSGANLPSTLSRTLARVDHSPFRLAPWQA